MNKLTGYNDIILRTRNSVKLGNMDAFSASEYIIKLFPSKNLYEIIGDIIGLNTKIQELKL